MKKLRKRKKKKRSRARKSNSTKLLIRAFGKSHRGPDPDSPRESLEVRTGDPEPERGRTDLPEAVAGEPARAAVPDPDSPQTTFDFSPVQASDRAIPDPPAPSRGGGLRLSILDRYLTRELLRAAFAVTVVLLLLIASKLVMQQLGYLMEGKFSSGIVTELLLNKLLAYFVHMLPFLVLLSSVLALGRMHRDAEMTALHSCGYSDARLLFPMALVGVPLAVVLGAMSLYITPRLALEAELAHHQARLGAGLDLMQEGRFMQTRHGRWALYASRTDGQAAEDVFFASYEAESQRVHIETAARATRTLDEEGGAYVLDFEDGRWHSGWPGDADFQTMAFDRHLLRVSMATPPNVWMQTKYMMPGPLWADGSAAAQAELQWRGSLPVSLLLMLALAIPLSRSSVRQGKYARAAYAIVIYLVYAQFQLLATSQVRGGNWPAWAGVWWVHGLMALGVIGLYYRARGSRA